MISLQLYTVLLCGLLSVLGQDLVYVGDVDEAEGADEAAVVTDDNEGSKEEMVHPTFVPRTEWQEILPGQAIPQGLHVRIDMQTGKKEARLMEAEETEQEAHARIARAMKNIKDDFKDNPKVQGTGKSKWRTMDELKSELKDVNLVVKEDYLVMKELVEQFQTSGDAAALEELEYHVHQYDNALDFLQLGGMQTAVLPALNSSVPAVRSAACFLLGGAAQSHPEVQGAALAAGTVPLLLRLTHLDPDPGVATKALYALSSVLRNQPAAQQEFLQQGGLSVLAGALREETAARHRLRVRVLTLLHDLLAESGPGDTLGLHPALRAAGLCGVWDQLLVLPRADRGARRADQLAARGDWPLRMEHDVVEKVLEALARMLPFCREELAASTELRSKLALLGGEYAVLRDGERAEDGGDTYFSDIAGLLGSIQGQLEGGHTEL